jgi:hypothetical protein
VLLLLLLSLLLLLLAGSGDGANGGGGGGRDGAGDGAAVMVLWCDLLPQSEAMASDDVCAQLACLCNRHEMLQQLDFT